MQEACDWLDKNHTHEKFFLHIESFDPHEPFYVPEPYRSMYGEYNEEFNCWPPYQDKKEFDKFMKDASEEELEFIRNQYSGKVTMTDRWLGKVFEKMDQYDLWKDTMVILSTDHGHALAEPEKKIKQFAKGHPIHEDVANIPLIIYHPEIEGNKRIASTFSTIVDIRSTILDVLGAKNENESLHVDGKSLLPILKGELDSIRDNMIYGQFGAGITITTWDTTYIRGFNKRKPINWYSTLYSMFMSPSVISGYGDVFGMDVPFEMAEKLIESMSQKIESGYFIPDVKIPQWKIPIPPTFISSAIGGKSGKLNYLYDRKKDPDFQNNLAGTPEAAELEKSMIEKMVKILKEENCPPEQFVRLMIK